MKTDLISFLFLFKILSFPGKFYGVRWFGFVSVCNLRAVLFLGLVWKCLSQDYYRVMCLKKMQMYYICLSSEFNLPAPEYLLFILNFIM